MLEKYINWDDVAIKALRHHDESIIALENLRQEYASITDSLGAVDYSKDRVSGTVDSDGGMVDRLLHKSSVEERIRQLVQDEQQYKRAWDALTEDERRVLSEFFQRGRRRSQEAVDTLCNLYGYERTKIWDMRREAVGRFKRLLVG